MTMPESGFCSSCGDVKACFHYPDQIVTNAYWSEMNAAVARREATEKREAARREKHGG